MEEQDSTNVSPRANQYLLGHKEAEDLFLESWKNGKIHNSWLICGQKGIGKATLAYKIARFMLSSDENKREKYTNIDVSPKDKVCEEISQNACYNLKVIERDFIEEDRKKVIKAIKDGEPMGDDELKNLRKSAVIKVDEVRTINEFMLKTSYDNRWKIVVVDSIDDMNINSANALLKILEEPPARSMLILISHNPDRLLPTIKSRCIKLMLKPLDEMVVASLLRRYRPQIEETDIKKIASMSEGSIGTAIEYADNNVLNYYEGLCKLASDGGKFLLSDMLSFADDATKSEETYGIAKDVILKFLGSLVQSGKNVENVVEVWQNAIKTFSETERLNMDKRHAIINIIYKICKNM